MLRELIADIQSKFRYYIETDDRFEAVTHNMCSLQTFIVTNDECSIMNSPIDGIPVKPMRPLTAYQIFLQIEREYIIQTSEGEIADKSSLDNKVYLDDVPERYKNIRLLRDWYVGPGKRKKRKHRKQHGKIGFLELSQIVSKRWAELDKVDPETKIFVQKIAKSEIDNYYREMKQYKDLIKDIEQFNMVTSKAVSSQITPDNSCSRSNIISKDSFDNNFAPQMMMMHPSPQHVFNNGMAPRRNVEAVIPSLKIMHLQTLQLQSKINQYHLAIIERRKQELLNLHLEVTKAQVEQDLLKMEEHDVKNSMLHKNMMLPLCDRIISESLVSTTSYTSKEDRIEARRSLSESLVSTSSYASEELDIDDDEIMALWKSCPAA
jgi:hypothetical protein